MADVASSLAIGALELSDPPDTELGYFTATIAGDGLRATSKVYAYMSQGLPALLAELANEWRGWEGERSWTSLERDLTLSFSHDGLGHIRVGVELCSSCMREWAVQTETRVDAGQLDDLAKRARRFFRQ